MSVSVLISLCVGRAGQLARVRSVTQVTGLHRTPLLQLYGGRLPHLHWSFPSTLTLSSPAHSKLTDDFLFSTIKDSRSGSAFSAFS